MIFVLLVVLFYTLNDLNKKPKVIKKDDDKYYGGYKK